MPTNCNLEIRARSPTTAQMNKTMPDVDCMDFITAESIHFQICGTKVLACQEPWKMYAYARGWTEKVSLDLCDFLLYVRSTWWLGFAYLTVVNIGWLPPPRFSYLPSWRLNH